MSGVEESGPPTRTGGAREAGKMAGRRESEREAEGDGDCQQQWEP